MDTTTVGLQIDEGTGGYARRWYPAFGTRNDKGGSVRMRPGGLKSVFFFSRRHDLMSSIKKRLWPVRVGCVIDGFTDCSFIFPRLRDDQGDDDCNDDEND